MPNTFAYLCLIAWPFISGLMYFRLNALTATFWTIFGGYLFLPVKVAFDFPLMPPLDKESISALSAIAGCIFIRKIPIQLIPNSGVERFLFITLLVTPLFSSFTNPEPVFDGVHLKPGLNIFDALSSIVGMYIALIPYLLGRSLIGAREDIVILLKQIVLAGFIYSPFILFEVRMSPQLHTWIYGFFPHSFEQQIRFGGFRAVVFLGHGLLVAIFCALTLLASCILSQELKSIFGLPSFLVVGYFFFFLVISKSLGAWVIGAIGLLIILILSSKNISRLSLAICFSVIVYPFSSIINLFPYESLIDTVATFSDQRARSLAYRFYNEIALLEHAGEKLWFGWGGWGRGRFADSITDGLWIIQISKYGVVGLFSMLLLLVLPIFVINFSRINTASPGGDKLISGFLLLVSLILVDQIPNASLHSWLWFIFGAASGVSICLRRGGAMFRGPLQDGNSERNESPYY